ncbi:MAG: HdeA/HdeB family chaperone [Pseudomonadota bacterium]
MIGSLLCGPSLSYAQTDNPDADERIIFKEVVCKDVMGQSGEDRDRTISFLHGFVMGGADRGEVTIAEIIDVESVFIDMCLDNPTDLVLDVMRTAHGVRNDQ